MRDFRSTMDDFLSKMRERNLFAKRNCWRVIVWFKLHPVARHRSMKPRVPHLKTISGNVLCNARVLTTGYVWLFNRALILCLFRSLSSSAISFCETTHKCLLTLNILIVGETPVPLSLSFAFAGHGYDRLYPSTPVNVHPSPMLYQLLTGYSWEKHVFIEKKAHWEKSFSTRRIW